MLKLEQRLQRLLFTRSEQQAFLEDVCALIKDGVPAPQAVNTVYEITKGPSKEVAKAILQSISEGQRLADGMQKWFPQSIVEIVRSGEEGGTLVQTLQVAVRSLGQQTSAITSLLASTIYPLVVVIMGLTVSVFLKHSVFENFAAIKSVAGWPIEGKLLLVVATFIETWWWLLILAVIGFGIIVRNLLINLTGEARHFIDAIPLFSLYKGYTAARFMETLGLLLNNGISFKRALYILQRNATRYLAWHIYLMQFKLSAGRENIADVLDTGMVSKENILRLRVIAKGKGFEQALLNLGRQALERNTKTIKVTGRFTGVFLLIAGAGFAIFMIFAIYNVGSYVGS